MRFDFYAERVESITCSNATLPEAAVTDTVYRWLLSARPGRVLFPRLCSLQWGCDMNGHRRKARFFDRDGNLVVRLEASAAPCPHDPIPFVVAYLCHALTCTMPWSSAIDLQCGAAADMGAFQPSLADALASLDNLRWLNLGADQAMAFENFEALASLPLLEGLRVENNDSEVYLCSNAPWAADNESPPPERTFRALTYLKLELYHVQDAAVLLSSFAFPSLRKLYAVGIARSRSMHFWRIMRLATTRCSHDRLESIEIGSGKDDGMGPVDRAAGAITRASLEHLSVFPNLQRVTVFSEMSIVVDDDLIRELATAWPFLKSLSLISGCPDDNRSWRQTEMTLRGLAFLVQHCRELSWLGMDIDTSNADTLVPPSDEYHNPHLRSFHWVCEPPLLSDPVKVGAFLFALFPNLNYLGDDYEDEYTVPKWKPVMEVIKELQRQRKAMEGEPACACVETHVSDIESRHGALIASEVSFSIAIAAASSD